MTRIRGRSLAGAAALAVVAAAGLARAEEGYGDLTGQFIFDGDVPSPIKIVAKGNPAVKDAAVCAAQDILSEELVVDPETKGIANIFVYVTAKDAKKLTIHPSLKNV